MKYGLLLIWLNALVVTILYCIVRHNQGFVAAIPYGAAGFVIISLNIAVYTVCDHINTAFGFQKELEELKRQLLNREK